MIDGYPHMWGMHWGWWIFWILAIVAVVWTLSTARRSAKPTEASGETPLETLNRRYAQGEISTEEFEERRERLKGEK